MDFAYTIPTFIEKCHDFHMKNMRQWSLAGLIAGSDVLVLGLDSREIWESVGIEFQKKNWLVL
jgi:hypothetical protein